ncbi:SIMPL domain-containing protein [Candidatus Micrarchaeota archaeon]|nr:SIMPL domain-containing protein [Candidatus Micrarchaeota archaeon]
MDVKILVLAVLSLVVLGLGITQVVTTISADEGIISTDYSEMEKTTINVNGYAKTSAEPDEAIINIVIETMDEDAGKSQSENAEITEKLEDQLLSLGINKEDIKTTYYNINLIQRGTWTDEVKPEYITQELGYKTVHNIQVKSSDIDSAGKIIDSAVESGAEVQGIYFQLSEEKRRDIEKELLGDAIKDARESADIIANAAGMDVTRMTSANYGSPSFYYPQRSYAYDVAMAESYSGGTAVYSGEMEVTISINAVFEAA